MTTVYPCQALGSPPLPGTQPLPVTPQFMAPYGAQPGEPFMPPGGPRALPQAADPALLGRYASLYAAVGGEPFPVPAVDLGRLDPQFLRRTVSLPDERAGRDHRDRSAKPLPLSGAGRRTGDPLRRRRRARGVRLVRDRQRAREAGMARLVSAQGDDRSASPSCAGS